MNKSVLGSGFAGGGEDAEELRTDTDCGCDGDDLCPSGFFDVDTVLPAIDFGACGVFSGCANLGDAWQCRGVFDAGDQSGDLIEKTPGRAEWFDIDHLQLFTALLCQMHLAASGDTGRHIDANGRTVTTRRGK
jgi:hypothetical protein